MLSRQLGTVVPLKSARFDRWPGLKATGLAAILIAQSAVATRRLTVLRLLNEAAILALWTLLPLRLGDGQLRWGRDVRLDAARYLVDIETAKEDGPP